MDHPIKILPAPDYAGYSQLEIWIALNNTFGDGSPVQLRPLTNEECEQIPLFQQVVHLINILVEEGDIKLTQTGNLPLKAVREIYEFGPPEKMIERDGYNFRSEVECDSVPVAREVARLIGAVKKRNNKLSVTAKGKKMLVDKPAIGAAIITAACTMRATFADRYEQEVTGMFEAGFVLLLLNKYGSEQRSVEFYYDKCLASFHDLRSEYDALYPFMFRMFHGRLLQLGVVEIIEDKFDEWKTEYRVVKTPLFDKRFTFLPPQ